jgi:inner membrane protein
MLIFGHTGITLGAAALAAHAVNTRKAGQAPDKSWFAPLSRYVDIRLLVIGSLLPDIIDKPLGQYFCRETFNNGRIFAHTLLFLVLITAAGYYLYQRQRRPWLLTLAAGVFTHLAFDEMWQVPATLFWPVLGLTFPKYDLTGWATNIFKALLSNPYIYVSEAIGLAIIIWLAAGIVSRKKVGAFIRYGKIN